MIFIKLFYDQSEMRYPVIPLQEKKTLKKRKRIVEKLFIYIKKVIVKSWILSSDVYNN